MKNNWEKKKGKVKNKVKNWLNSMKQKRTATVLHLHLSI